MTLTELRSWVLVALAASTVAACVAWNGSPPARAMRQDDASPSSSGVSGCDEILASGTPSIEHAPSGMSAFDPNSPEQAGETGNAADYPFDLVFIDAMAGHHAGAVAMARIALDRSQRPEVRELASAIIAAKDAEIDVLRGWRAGWFAEDDPVPANVVTGLLDEGLMTSGAMGGMGRGSVASDTGLALARLCANDGPFDLVFLTEMIPYLQGSTGMARLATERAERPELTALAGEIVTAQEGWLALMSGWQAEWYPQGPTGGPPDTLTPVAGTQEA